MHNFQDKELGDLFRKTNAFKKIKKAIETLEKDAAFIKGISELRLKLKINQRGLPLPKDQDDFFNSKLEIFSKQNSFDENNFYDALYAIEEKYGLNFIGDLLEYYVLYGSLEPFEKFGHVSIASVYDLKETLSNENNAPGDPDINILSEYFQTDLPIAILINPYMTREDIINFVETMYTPWIKPIQLKHRKNNTPVGKARKKSDFAKERNAFILKNKDKSAKDIMSLVSDKFHQSLDYTYIQKILRDEKRKI